MLVENTLFLGRIDKVQLAVDRLRQFEPPEGYYGAFSGGKDSVALKAVASLAEVKVDWHYNLTTVDPPEIVQFIRQQHPEVQIHRPAMTMWQLIGEKKRMPPTRIARWCCEYLKEGRGSERETGRLIITGIRWAESSKRAGRRTVEQCKKGKGRIFVNPIIDWEDEDVWEFIKAESIAYCSLYDEGFKRLGCIGCPLAGKEGMLREFKRWPKYRKAYERAFGRMLKRLADEGVETKWADVDELMEWWIYNPPKGDPDQTVLFE